MARARIGSQNGFTLVEVMVAMMVLLVGMLGVLTMLDGANAVTVKTKQREAATNLQRELVEGARSVPYEQLTPNGLRAALQAMPGLADTALGGGWTIERRATEFAVVVTVCSVDDPRDGLGDRSSGTFCAGQAAGIDDRSPDDYKRIVVDLEWGPASARVDSRQATVVPNPSNNLGPEIVALERDPDDDMIVDDVASIDFTATAATTPEAVRFLIDGAVAATEAPTGEEAQFEWTIDSGGTYVVDGTYVISATALNHSGLAGPSQSLTVRLNRHAPAAVTGLIGGWNAYRDAVDLEWNQNEESDIVGYRVYRSADGGAWEQVCSTGPAVTECHDDSHPEPFADGYEYYAVALDEVSDTGTTREGEPSETLPVVPSDLGPNPPGTLTRSAVAGHYRLDWTVPAATAVPYPGDGILFFRIYRDGLAVADRIDRTGLGTDLTFTDVEVPSTEEHQYAVTAVDENYSESEPLVVP
jgi:prepilin-type N-terminal cleavage/methylation domain-containing protein